MAAEAEQERGARAIPETWMHRLPDGWTDDQVKDLELPVEGNCWLGTSRSGKWPWGGTTVCETNGISSCGASGVSRSPSTASNAW
ncbi:hypothetical protein AB0B15_17925 [Streptomyces sp. NPDC045456]|uniref:hypothetical protein n=1 Tax=Streptomyces sp. NPDC045456 TaxID=3155254 RepID=UPI0033EEBC64